MLIDLSEEELFIIYHGMIVAKEYYYELFQGASPKFLDCMSKIKESLLLLEKEKEIAKVTKKET